MSGNLLHALYDGRGPLSEAYEFYPSRARNTRELRRTVAQMARALVDRGLRPGDRLSFKLEKCEEALFLAHACFQIGVVLHPLNAAYTDAEVEQLVRDAEPRLLVCAPDEAQRLSNLCQVEAATLSPGMTGELGGEAAALEPLCETRAVSPSDTAALLYTSGTTGRPKGACITHGNLAESARALATVWNLQPTDRLLHALPLYHAHGLLTSINSMMVGGGAIRFLQAFREDDALAALPGASVLMGVPTHYARLLKHDALGRACRDLRLAISGSAPLPAETSDGFFRLTGQRINERYGATETAIVTAVPAGEQRRQGFVGWALPGVSIRVVDAEGRAFVRGATGGLQTKGHNVFAGYWRRQEADADAFTADGWFITGDIASIDETGCVELLGRSKDIIISGGLNVYPKEVENALDSLLVGCESAVIGVPHPDFGEAVVALVENHSGPVNEAELIRSLRRTLAPYKTPKRVIAIPGIPRNTLGKVLKNELRAAYRHLFTSESNQKG